MKNFVVAFILLLPFHLYSQSILKGSGKVDFVSNAPLEIIKASSSNLKGVLDTANASFAFTIPMNSFIGFNSPLQQEHYNEHYLETNLYANASFKGKIVENVDWSKLGKLNIRAKGKFTIHGVSLEKIIPVEIEITKTGVYTKANFSIILEEFDIKLPKIVFNKIAESIDVSVLVDFK